MYAVHHDFLAIFCSEFYVPFFKTLKALFSLLYDWTPIPKCLGVVTTFHGAKAEHFSMVWQCSIGLSSLGMKSPSTHHNIFSTKRVLSLVRAPQCAIAFSCVLGQKQKHET